MKVTTTPVEVWSTEIDDQPGGLARALRAITEFGANLDYVAAHRQRDQAAKGMLYVASADRYLYLDRVADVGLKRVSDRALLRIEGHDQPGAGAKLARVIAAAGVNMRSFAASASEHHFVCYAEFDSIEDRAKADAALKALNTHPSWAFWYRHSTAA